MLELDNNEMINNNSIDMMNQSFFNFLMLSDQLAVMTLTISGDLKMSINSKYSMFSLLYHY